jgi:bifunctional non-homologous end joining protein LigD
LRSAPATLRYSDHVQGSGKQFLAQACRLNLEGAVSKRADSTYAGIRSRDWVKIKCSRQQELVIGGFTDPKGRRPGLGALLLGVYEPEGGLRYSGKVGTGFDQQSLDTLRKKLEPLERNAPPFQNPPRGFEARGVHWVKPELVAEVGFAEWTADGTLRQPSFKGLREDKKAAEVVRESAQPMTSSSAGAEKKPGSNRRAPAAQRAAAAPASVAGVALSHPDKLLYPDAKLSKLDLARYYEAVGDWIVPHLQNRPLSLLRCPNGWQSECFFQKHADKSVHAAVKKVMVPQGTGSATYMMVNSASGIVGLVQLGVLELHPWGARAPKLERPDRLVFDFDPDEAISWEQLAEAVGLARSLLGELGLTGFLKTTGGKGLHVVLPIRPTLSWDQAKRFTRAVAELMVNTFPDRFVASAAKTKRIGRIFIDYLRNAEGATAVAAFSTRARANAPVATPIAWDEIDRDLRFDYFNLRSVPERLARLKADPWAQFFSMKQSVTAAMLKRLGVAG